MFTLDEIVDCGNGPGFLAFGGGAEERVAHRSGEGAADPAEESSRPRQYAVLELLPQARGGGGGIHQYGDAGLVGVAGGEGATDRPAPTVCR
jgi:hypothetical protein